MVINGFESEIFPLKSTKREGSQVILCNYYVY